MTSLSSTSYSLSSSSSSLYSSFSSSSSFTTPPVQPSKPLNECSDYEIERRYSVCSYTYSNDIITAGCSQCESHKITLVGKKCSYLFTCCNDLHLVNCAVKQLVFIPTGRLQQIYIGMDNSSLGNYSEIPNALYYASDTISNLMKLKKDDDNMTNSLLPSIGPSLLSLEHTSNSSYSSSTMSSLSSMESPIDKHPSSDTPDKPFSEDLIYTPTSPEHLRKLEKEHSTCSYFYKNDKIVAGCLMPECTKSHKVTIIRRNCSDLFAHCRTLILVKCVVERLLSHDSQVEIVLDEDSSEMLHPTVKPNVTYTASEALGNLIDWRYYSEKVDERE